MTFTHEHLKKKTLMLLVLLLSLCKSCQISPFRIAHECFILESGCKSTHFPGNFQMFSEKSLIFKRNLIYVKPKTAFHKERARHRPPGHPRASRSRAHPKAVDAGERHAVGRQVTCCWKANPMRWTVVPIAIAQGSRRETFSLTPQKKKKKKYDDDVSRTHVRRRIISIVSIISIISIISIYRSHAWLSSS